MRHIVRDISRVLTLFLASRQAWPKILKGERSFDVWGGKFPPKSLDRTLPVTVQYFDTPARRSVGLGRSFRKSERQLSVAEMTRTNSVETTSDRLDSTPIIMYTSDHMVKMVKLTTGFPGRRRGANFPRRRRARAESRRSMTAHITVCTVVQDCCKSRSNKYRKWHFLGSCRPETP